MVVPVPAHSEHTLGGHGHAAGVAGGGHLFRSGVLLAIGSRSVSTLSFAMANGARGSRAGVASLSSSSSSSSSLVWGWCGRGWGDVSFGSLWGLKAGGGRVCPFRFSLVCPCTAGCRGGVMTPRERKGGECSVALHPPLFLFLASSSGSRMISSYEGWSLLTPSRGWASKPQPTREGFRARRSKGFLVPREALTRAFVRLPVGDHKTSDLVDACRACEGVWVDSRWPDLCSVA